MLRRSPDAVPRAAGVLLAALFLLVSPSPGQEDLAVFEAPVFAFDFQSRVEATADLDGDGDVDALSWWYEGSNFRNLIVRGFRNDGTGKFQELFRWVEPASSSLGRTIEVGDFNGDGRGDFLLWFSQGVRVYTSDPQGRPVLYDQFQVPTEPRGRAAAVADFDGDGRDDLALSSGGLRILLNQGTGFAPAVVHRLAGRIHVADLNGDAAPDLLFGNWLTWDSALNDGSGRFTQGPSWFHGLRSDQNGEQMDVVGDIDGDGDQDAVLFVSRGEYSVLRRTGPAQFTVESPVPGGPATGLADIDGDGDLDGVCCGGGGDPNYANLYPSTYHVSINRGGVFDDAWQIPNVGARRLAGAHDVDGDGDVDLIAGRTVLFNTGETFARDPMPRFEISRGVFRLADVDGDGDPDEDMTLSGVHRNAGDGRFSVAMPHVAEMPPGVTLVGPGDCGDFDGDGDADLLVGSLRQGVFEGMRLLANSGGGHFLDGGLMTTDNLDPRNGTRYFGGHHVLDVDGDGDVDLVTEASSPDLFLNDGRGGLTRAAPFADGWLRGHGDLDGDGFPDLVFHDLTQATIRFGRGDGTFDPTPVTVAARWFRTTDQLAVFDLEGDGTDELCVIDRSTGQFRNDARLVRHLGNRSFSADRMRSTPLAANGSARRLVCAGDFDGDGDVDLLLYPAQYTGNGSWFLPGDGVGGFGRAHEIVAAPMGSGDVDGDGDVDLLTWLDAWSALVVRGRANAGGTRVQYGDATAGAAGVRPVLGATGPFVAGGSIELRAAGLPSTGLGVLVFGADRGATPGWFLPGLTLLVDTVVATHADVLHGTPGTSGSGRWNLPLAVPASVAGSRVTAQVFVLDATPPGPWSQSNGLELRFD